MNQMPANRVDKLLLGVMSLTTLAFGTAYLVAPEFMAAQSGLAVTRPEAVAEFRGYYGGLQIAMGVLFARGLRDSRWAFMGLNAAALLFIGNGLGRLVGIALAWKVDSYNLIASVFEFAFSLLAIRQIRHQQRPARETR